MKHLNLKWHSEYLEDFYKTQEFAASLNDKLAKNYTKKDLNLDDFPFFSICIEEDIIVAFSGLYTGRWGPGIGRVASRLWVHPDFRSRNGVPSNYNSTVMMPNQALYAENNGYDLVFFSREAPYKHFDYICKRSTKACKYGYEWKPLDKEYNVCVNRDKPSCWQKVAVCKFNDRELELQCR